MYFPNPSDYVQAFDAATGDLKWEYRRTLPDDLAKYFPVSSINRNLAIYDHLIVDTSADDFVYALDARSGALVWEHKILDYQKGAQQTSGPIIARGTIISGRGCEPEGVPTPASSRRTTLRPAGNCGGRGRSRRRTSRVVFTLP